MDFIVLVIIATLWVFVLSYITVEKADWPLVLSVSLIFILISMSVLYVMNNNMPFRGGGDDEMYFDRSFVLNPHSFYDVFDFESHFDYYGQTGYVTLLSVWRALGAKTLYACKVLNLLFYISIAFIWYRIGMIIKSRKMALLLFFSIILTSPFWQYYSLLLT